MYNKSVVMGLTEADFRGAHDTYRRPSGDCPTGAEFFLAGKEERV
ncbi:hypothetical protein [uncultured Megasphaera sp.]|nr:hypothetical protein [uncultured Megasphaera sp.]